MEMRKGKCRLSTGEVLQGRAVNCCHPGAVGTAWWDLTEVSSRMGLLRGCWCGMGDRPWVPGAAGRRPARFGSCWVCAGCSEKVPVVM